jgi:type IV pilus assembly protein PilM
MAASNVFWGIEIGASSIKAIKLERNDEEVKVLDFAVIPHPKPLSTPGFDANDVLRVSLGTLASQYDLSKAGIAVSVPGHAALARFTKLPPVERKRVPDVVKFEAMQQIPFPLDQVEWDYQVFQQPDSPDVGAGIFAITKEKVNERLSMLSELQLTPDVLSLSPVAVYNALAFDLNFDSQTPGTIVVDVGTTSTDIIIAEPGRMWIRTFPVGGHQFTDALVNQFQLGYPKAEKLKREAEDSKHARQVFQAMRPVFTDLATEVQKSVAYYQVLYKDANLTRLIGVGSTFKLPGLRKYFKQQLSIEVYRVEEFKRAKLASDAAPDRVAAFNDASLNLCTAYGLALQGLELNACAGNLMPASILKESMWEGKSKWFIGAAACAVLASGAMFLRPVMDSIAVKSKLPDQNIQRVSAEASRLAKLAQEAGVTGDGQPDMKAANMVQLLAKRDIYPHIVNDLGLLLADGEKGATDLKGPGGAALTPPVFSVFDFRTEYFAPSAPVDPSMGGMDGGSGTSDDPEPAAIKAFQRVHCELRLVTDAEEPQRHVRDTFGKWIDTMVAKEWRDDVPYRIYKFERMPMTSVVDAGTGLTPASGAGEMSDFSQPVGGRRAMGSGRNPLTEAAMEREQRGSAPSGAGELTAAPVKVDVDAVAPLGVAPPAKPKHIVTVRWIAVVEPKKPAENAEGGKQ